VNRVLPDRERRNRTLALILPPPSEALTPGSQRSSLALRPSEKARLRELTAALNRRADGRRIFTMSSTIRYALDVLYVDVFDVSPQVISERNQKEAQ
jgi:hypothetical protein